jgi:hypothetical protein
MCIICLRMVVVVGVVYLGLHQLLLRGTDPLQPDDLPPQALNLTDEPRVGGLQNRELTPIVRGLSTLIS